MQPKLLRQHGGKNQYGMSDQMIDFSVNINPFGPSPAMKEAIAKVPYDQYPDPHGRELITALALRHKVRASEVYLGNGAAEIFWTIVRSHPQPPGTAVILEPTFSEFRVALETHEFPTKTIRSSPENGFKHSLSTISQALQSHEPDYIYICNPNSPTGTYLESASIASIAKDFPRTIFVLDQAFLHISSCPKHLELRYPPNVLRVFSLTKEHSIAGLRIGYALGDQQLISRLERFTNTWNVNALALTAGLAACTDDLFVEQSWQKITTLKNQLCDGLTRIGVKFHSDRCPFLLLHIGKQAPALAQFLADRGCLVRDCSSYDLSGWLRIFPRLQPENNLLLKHMEDFLIRKERE